MKETMLTVEEVAAKLRICPQTVRNYAQDKRLPAYKIAEQFRFKPEDVDAFIATRKVKP